MKILKNKVKEEHGAGKSPLLLFFNLSLFVSDISDIPETF